MNEQQLSNAIFDALVKFQEHTMNNFGNIMEKSLESLPQVLQSVKDSSESEECKDMF